LVVESFKSAERTKPNSNILTDRAVINYSGTTPSEINDAPEIEWPLKPGKAIKTFEEVLTDFEKGEILDFKQVWCVGEKCKTKIHGSITNPYNDGYDDDKGDFLI
jgi:dual specificity tyrosine-phosphorylation-regulated kinase 2/3/4